MHSLILSLFACAPSTPGENEDALGQPRDLLANCSLEEAWEGELDRRVSFDGQGYPAEIEDQDGGLLSWSSTTLDELGRPVAVERTVPSDEEGVEDRVYLDEFSYEEDSWRLHFESSTADGETERLEYLWTDEGYTVDLGDGCSMEATLAEGLRLASLVMECDGEELYASTMSWDEDRLATDEVTMNLFGEIRMMSTYSYDADGRLETQLVDMEMDGEPDETVELSYDWDCGGEG